MSRLRENPERLFEVFLEIGKPSNEKEEPFILQKYPLDFKDEEVLKSVPKFAFPCDTERYTTTVDHFTVTFTDLDSKFKFGFCRHATGAQTCFCIVSFLPWFEVFYNMLNSLAEITNRTEDNDITHLLRAAFVQEVPGPGLPVTVVANQEMFSFKAPDPNKLPAIPTSRYTVSHMCGGLPADLRCIDGSTHTCVWGLPPPVIAGRRYYDLRNLTEYYNAIDTENMMIIFASMLHERRIIIISKRLSRLAAVVHAATTLLYPMHWQHLFIPVLPAFLVDYLTAPMPFVIGVHSKLMESVRPSELGDAVIVDADKSTVQTEYDDLEDLPVEVASYLKRHLKTEKVKNSMQGSGDVISKTFMMSLVKLIGGYRDALKFTEGDPITFCPDAFVQSRPVSMQPFLNNMLQLQIFQQFINERLDILNCGRGFSDIFEQECLLHVDKLNAQTRYNEWMRKMKHQGKKFQKSGKDVWGDIKDKAGPAMSVAMETVKSSGKKAYSKARTKISDLKKEEQEVGTKHSKASREGSKSKSFSKDKPMGIIKDRPSTIVGAPIRAQRPPRPSMSPSADNVAALVRPHVPVQQSSRERLSRLALHSDQDHRVSTDDSDLYYNRVSVNLLADPQLQNAMFKSASAENIPKTIQTVQEDRTLLCQFNWLSFRTGIPAETNEIAPFMFDGYKILPAKCPKESRSTETLSTDSSDGIEPTSVLDDSGGQKFMYSALVDDDDSGIVVRAGSQSSLDTQKAEFSANAISDRDRVPIVAPRIVVSESTLAPPRAAPRKSISPNVVTSSDKLIKTETTRPRPQPLPRRASLDKKAQGDGNSLISLESPPESVDLASQFEQVTASGDYVVLREPKTNQSNITPNRRSIINRTPAMKLTQSETPKRPTVRREQSPDDPMLDFDPLFNKNGSSLNISAQKLTSDCDSSDSLLKEWNISGLTTTAKSPPMGMGSGGVGAGGQYPAAAPRRSVLLNNYNSSSSFNALPNKPNVQIPLTYQNALHSKSTPPPVPPKVPLPKPAYDGCSRLPQPPIRPSQDSKVQRDPFADLVSLNTSASSSSSSSPAKQTWETFD